MYIVLVHSLYGMNVMFNIYTKNLNISQKFYLFYGSLIDLEVVAFYNGLGLER